MNIENNIIKLNCGTRRGTALLINKNHAVTVKHCVSDAYSEKSDEIVFNVIVGEQKIPVSLAEGNNLSDDNQLVCLLLAENVENINEIKFVDCKIKSFQEFHMFGFGKSYVGGSWIQLKFIGSENVNKDCLCDLRFGIENSRGKTFEGFSGSPVFDKNHTFVVGIISQEEIEDREAIFLEGISVISQKDFLGTYGIIVEKEEYPDSPPNKKPISYKMTKKNNLFTGRAEIIENIIKKLKKDQLVFLVGGGGMGKTQIAQEIVSRIQDSYELIMWFTASTETELLNEFNNAARGKRLVARICDDFDYIASVLYTFIEKFSHSLIIYDGADDIPIEFLNEKCFFPCSDIIITTQNSNVDRNEFSVIEIDAFTFEDAISFLMTNATNRKQTEQDAKIVFELCNLLENYPLSLEYARAYVNKMQISFKEYIQIYEEHKFDILDVSVSKYKKTAYKAWEISYNKVVQQSADARNILNMVSFLDIHDIPLRNIFVLTEQYSEYELNLAIETIKNYSLFTSNKYLSNIHEITQEFTRWQMKKDGEYQKYYEKILQIFLKIMPYQITNASDKQLAVGLIKHAIKLISHNCNINNEDTLQLTLIIASNLYVLDSYMQTIEFIQEQFKKYGSLEQNFYMLQMITFLSQAYHYAGNDFKSLEILEKYISIVSFTKVLTDIQKKELLLRYKNLKGIVQKERGDYKASLNTFFELMEFMEQPCSEIDYEIKCNLLINIGIVYKHLGNFHNAIEYYKQALTYSNYEKNILLRIYGNMATAYREINEIEFSYQYYKKCLELSQELGNQRNECICCRDLGNLYIGLQQYDKAESYFKESLKIALDINFVLGIIDVSYDFGYLALLQQNYIDARKYWEISLEKSCEINDKGLIQRSVYALRQLL